MAFLKKMKAKEYIDKTRAYLEYLEEHIENVRLAFDNLSRDCDGMQWVGDDMTWHFVRQEVYLHDVSKFSKEEFTQYRKSFHPIAGEKQDEWAFVRAWEHHKDNNKHHHQVVDNFNEIVLMVIDWTAMGYKFGDTAQEYYEANKEKIKLTDEQVEFMYEIFGRIKGPLSK